MGNVGHFNPFVTIFLKKYIAFVSINLEHKNLVGIWNIRPGGERVSPVLDRYILLNSWRMKSKVDLGRI